MKRIKMIIIICYSLFSCVKITYFNCHCLLTNGSQLGDKYRCICYNIRFQEIKSITYYNIIQYIYCFFYKKIVYTSPEGHCDFEKLIY